MTFFSDKLAQDKRAGNSPCNDLEMLISQAAQSMQVSAGARQAEEEDRMRAQDLLAVSEQRPASGGCPWESSFLRVRKRSGN